MQRLPLSLLFFAAVATVFIACKKEPLREAVDQTGIVKSGERPSGKDCYKGVRIECGMLSFTDQAHFQEVYDCLEAAYEAHLDGYEAQYGYLSEDDYNDMADQLGFVDEQPLIDFEGALGVTSYRAHLAALEDAWLANGAIDSSNPLLNDVFVDDILATLFNKDGAVMVGGVINYWAPNGDIYQIAEGDCTLYDCIRLDPSQCDLTNVRLKHHNDSDSLCGPHYAVEDSTVYFDGNNRKVFWLMKFHHTGGGFGPWGGQHMFRSQIWSYRRKNGGWRKRKVSLAEQLQGIAYNPEEACKTESGHVLQTPKRRRTRKNKKGFWPKPVDFSVRDKSLWCNHQFWGSAEVDYIRVQ